MRENKKDISETVMEEQITIKVDTLISKSIRNDILKIYWEYKPRYIPNFIYIICLRRFMLMEYNNLGSITKLLGTAKRMIDNETKLMLHKQAKTIGYSLVKSDKSL